MSLPNTAQGLRLSFYRRYKHQFTRQTTAASDSIPGKGRDSSLLENVLSGSGTPSSRRSNGVSAALSMSIRRLGTEAGPSPPYSVEVTNSQNYISTLPYVFMTWCLIMQRHLTHNTIIWDSTTIRNTTYPYRSTNVFYFSHYSFFGGGGEGSFLIPSPTNSISFFINLFMPFDKRKQITIPWIISLPSRPSLQQTALLMWFTYVHSNRDSVVGMVISIRAKQRGMPVRFPAQTSDLSLLQSIKTGCGTYPSTYWCLSAKRAVYILPITCKHSRPKGTKLSRRCMYGYLKRKLLLPSASALEFKSQATKVLIGTGILLPQG